MWAAEVVLLHKLWFDWLLFGSKAPAGSALNGEHQLSHHGEFCKFCMMQWNKENLCQLPKCDSCHFSWEQHGSVPWGTLWHWSHRGGWPQKRPYRASKHIPLPIAHWPPFCRPSGICSQLEFLELLEHAIRTSDCKCIIINALHGWFQ